jgi:hypothetical protein
MIAKYCLQIKKKHFNAYIFANTRTYSQKYVYIHIYKQQKIPPPKIFLDPSSIGNSEICSIPLVEIVRKILKTT